MDNNEHKEDPAFLAYVYDLNTGHSLTEAFKLSLKDIDTLDLEPLKRVGHRAYAEDKWTLHQILQHLIDWERIWCFRAILFARAEGSIPDAHDQEIMAENSNANDRSIDELISELRIVRQSSMMLFNSFSPAVLDTTCRFFEYQMPLKAIGLTITAHQIHHFKVIKDRYLQLAEV